MEPLPPSSAKNTPFQLLIPSVPALAPLRPVLLFSVPQGVLLVSSICDIFSAIRQKREQGQLRPHAAFVVMFLNTLYVAKAWLYGTNAAGRS